MPYLQKQPQKKTPKKNSGADTEQEPEVPDFVYDHWKSFMEIIYPHKCVNLHVM